MSKPIHATLDGKVFVPDELPDLPPNMRVEVKINGELAGSQPDDTERERYKFLKIAASMNLDLGPNASERVHEVLYGLDGR